MKLAEAIDYRQKVVPATAVPIHDAVRSNGGSPSMITHSRTGITAHRQWSSDICTNRHTW
jgi:hypothetical protein